MSLLAVSWSSRSLAADIPDKMRGQAYYLYRISEELRQLIAITEKSAHSAAASGSVHFDFTSLSTDLHSIRQALLNHLSAPSRQPLRVKPLLADYDCRETRKKNGN